MGINSFPKPSTIEDGPKNNLRKLLDEFSPGSIESGQLIEIRDDFYQEWKEKNLDRLGNRDESVSAERFTQTEHEEGHAYVDAIEVSRIRDVINDRIQMAEKDFGDPTQTEDYRKDALKYKKALEKIRMKLAAS